MTKIFLILQHLNDSKVYNKGTRYLLHPLRTISNIADVSNLLSVLHNTSSLYLKILYQPLTLSAVLSVKYAYSTVRA